MFGGNEGDSGDNNNSGGEGDVQGGIFGYYTRIMRVKEVIITASAFVLGVAANNLVQTVSDETVSKFIESQYDLSDTKLKYGGMIVHYGKIFKKVIELVAVSITIFVIITSAAKYLA